MNHTYIYDEVGLEVEGWVGVEDEVSALWVLVLWVLVLGVVVLGVVVLVVVVVQWVSC